MPDLVRRLRRRLNDEPVVSRCTGGSPVPNQSTVTTITVPDGHVSKFRPGARFEFDDNSGERLEVDSTSVDASTVDALRAREGTDPAQHQNGTDIVIEPRWSYPLASEILQGIIDEELWPDVWIFGESTLSYHPTNDYYSPSVTDIETVVYAYQLVNGHRYSLGFNWLSPELVADTNGAITIPQVADYSSIFYAYRIRPTLTNLTTQLERLVLIAGEAELDAIQESAHVSPDRSAVDATVGDGASLRQSLLRRQMFEDGRTRERTRLLALEFEKMPSAGALLG